MAREFAQSFYKSKQWKLCRESYIAKVQGLCEQCLSKGKLTPGYIVHHRQMITPDNIGNPEITLNHSNLELLCIECHNSEHYGSPVTREDVMFDDNGDVISILPPSKGDYMPR